MQSIYESRSDADLHSVGPFYHGWVTNAVTDLVLNRLNETTLTPRYRWDSLLAGQELSLQANKLALYRYWSSRTRRE